MIYSLKDYYPTLYAKVKTGKGKAPTIPEGTALDEWARIRHVEPLKNHPALLAWYINDEQVPVNKGKQGDARDRIVAMQNMIHQADPNHPTLSVANRRWSKPSQYLGATDIISGDPYPIPREPISTAGKYLQQLVVGLNSKMPVWYTVQAFDLGVYRGVGNSQEPTFNEIRCLAYLGLTRDVKGILFYSYHDLARRAGRRNEDQLLFDRRWSQMRAIAPELKQLGDVLLHGQAVGVTISPTSSRDASTASLSYAARMYDGRLYLMLANDADKPLSVKVELPAGSWVIGRICKAGPWMARWPTASCWFKSCAATRIP